MFDKDMLSNMTVENDPFRNLLEYVEHTGSRRTVVATKTRRIYVVAILNAATNEEPYYILSPAFTNKKAAKQWFEGAVQECKDIGFVSSLHDYTSERKEEYYKATCTWTGRFVEYKIHALELIKGHRGGQDG